MTPPRLQPILSIFLLATTLTISPLAHAQDKRGKLPDSYKYYGPNGLWEQWNDPKNKDAAAQRLGRDTWIHWTWGNQKTLRKASVLAGNLPVPISIDLFRLLDSRKRGSRFKDLGLINEPNCRSCTEQEKIFDLYLDIFEKEKEDYYPVEYDLLGTNQPRQMYSEAYKLKYPESGKEIDLRHFGHPSGIVGVRLFRNPAFTDEAKKNWDVKKYFENPGKVEPPFLVGFSCAFCHIAFDPNNPPKDPENPRWENLAANIGNQYLREGDLFFGRGRILFGNKHSEAKRLDDPYQTSGLTEKNFLYHYGATQQPGTSETSRISYDFINNPNTINPIYGLKYRPMFEESTVWGRKRTGQEAVWHALKDGADAVGIDWAIMRVPLNVGCEGDYWVDQLFNPAIGRKQRPVRIADLLMGLKDPKERAAVELSTGMKFDDSPPSLARHAELKMRYRSPYGNEEFGEDWQEAWRRVGSLAKYLISYEPARLKDAAPVDSLDAAAVKTALTKDVERLKRGAKLFGKHCAECHSSKQPYTEKDKKDPEFFEWSAQAPFFLHKNFLSDEKRYSVTKLGTNMARALATNGVDADVWAEFSSPEYKALPSVGRKTLSVPVFSDKDPWPLRKPIRVEFDPPGGGRGYYRTPSLISLWATAPYLHNNSVGDYLIVEKDERSGKVVKRRVPNNGTPVVGTLDVSVEGRLWMFNDAMRKLLTPSLRHRYVKRTSAESFLVFDLHGSIHKTIAHFAGEALKQEFRIWLRENRDLPAPPEVFLKLVEESFEKAVEEHLKSDELRAAWINLLREKGKAHAIKLFDQTIVNLHNHPFIKEKFKGSLTESVREAVKKQFLERVGGFDERVKESLQLKIRKDFPINLYANLNSAALPHAVLAHAQHRDDPRALAEALLQMSECPDLVEDEGHLFGSDLTDREKDDLIEFLKTF